MINKDENGEEVDFGQVHLEINMTSFFSKYWHGEYSLPFSYWLVLAVGNAVLFAIPGKIAIAAGNVALGSIWLLFAGIPYYIWSFGGAWNSAAKRPMGDHWGNIARIVMVFGLLSSVFKLVNAIVGGK